MVVHSENLPESFIPKTGRVYSEFLAIFGFFRFLLSGVCCRLVEVVQNVETVFPLCVLRCVWFPFVFASVGVTGSVGPVGFLLCGFSCRSIWKNCRKVLSRGQEGYRPEFWVFFCFFLFRVVWVWLSCIRSRSKRRNSFPRVCVHCVVPGSRSSLRKSGGWKCSVGRVSSLGVPVHLEKLSESFIAEEVKSPLRFFSVCWFLCFVLSGVSCRLVEVFHNVEVGFPWFVCVVRCLWLPFVFVSVGLVGSVDSVGALSGCLVAVQFEEIAGKFYPGGTKVSVPSFECFLGFCSSCCLGWVAV